MVAYCCVLGCNNKKDKKNSCVSFHSFPASPLLKKKWLWAIGRVDWEPPSYARVCSAHFSAQQIKQEGNRTRIVDDACPCNALPPKKLVLDEICRICLATDVKMYSLKNGDIRFYILNIPGFIESLITDGMPQSVCYECAVQLKKCWSLINKSMRSKKILLDMITENGQIDKSLVHLNREYLKLKTLLTKHEETPMHLYYFKYDDRQNVSILTNTEFVGKVEEKNDDIRYIPDIWPNVSDTFDNNTLHEEVMLKMEADSGMKKSDSDCELITDDHEEEQIFVVEMKNSMSNNVPNLDPIDVCTEPITEIACTNESEAPKIRDNEPPRKSKKTNVPGRKSLRINGFTPDEIALQKYFDIIQINTLQEQMDDWKEMIDSSQLEGRGNVTKCEVCSKHFVMGEAYKRHCTYHDPSRGNVECPVCKIRYKRGGKLRSHLNSIHGRKFHCRSCNKVYRSLTAAKNHQKFHTGDQHKCDHCSYSTRHRSTLFTHILRNHRHSLACEICGRTCISTQSLYQHRAFAHAGYSSTERIGIGALGPYKVLKVLPDGKLETRLLSTGIGKKRQAAEFTVPWRFEKRSQSSESDYEDNFLFRETPDPRKRISFDAAQLYTSEASDAGRSVTMYVTSMEDDMSFGFDS